MGQKSRTIRRSKPLIYKGKRKKIEFIWVNLAQK
jgi:hypothetical protein